MHIPALCSLAPALAAPILHYNYSGPMENIFEFKKIVASVFCTLVTPAKMECNGEALLPFVYKATADCYRSYLEILYLCKMREEIISSQVPLSQDNRNISSVFEALKQFTDACPAIINHIAWL